MSDDDTRCEECGHAAAKHVSNDAGGGCVHFTGCDCSETFGTVFNEQGDG